VTFHGTGKGGDDVVVFPLGQQRIVDGARDGIPLFGKDKVDKLALRELRGLQLVQSGIANNQQNSLFVANGNKKDSKLLKYDDACVLEKAPLSVWARNESMIHPYGMAHGDNSLWVTNQDTGTVMQYPMFDAFTPKVIATLKQPRAVVHSPELKRIFVAERTGTPTRDPAPGAGHIRVYSSLTGLPLGTHNFPGPVGMSMYVPLKGKPLMLVGSEQTNKVYGIDPETLEQQHTFEHADLQHPAGLSVHGNQLFVVSQTNKRIIQFDLISGKGKVVVDNLPGRAECIVALTCVPRKVTFAEPGLAGKISTQSLSV